MSDFQYTHPADNIAGAVTPTLSSGTTASGYSVANLSDNDPSKPWKASTTTFRLVWDWGSAQTVKVVALIHHNLQASLSGVKFEMNAADSWGAPSFSQTLTVPAYHEDDFPANVYADISATSPSYRYGSLAVTSANIVACSIGELVISTGLRSLTGCLMVDASDDEEHPIVEHRTDVGVSTIYAHGTRWRWVRGDKVQAATDAQKIRALNRASQGRSLPFVILPHLQNDEPFFVRFEKTTLPRTYMDNAWVSRYRLEFEEVSRGLIPTPSAV